MLTMSEIRWMRDCINEKPEPGDLAKMRKVYSNDESLLLAVYQYGFLRGYDQSAGEQGNREAAQRANRNKIAEILFELITCNDQTIEFIRKIVYRPNSWPDYSDTARARWMENRKKSKEA